MATVAHASQPPIPVNKEDQELYDEAGSVACLWRHPTFDTPAVLSFILGQLFCFSFISIFTPLSHCLYLHFIIVQAT
ncbi:hypothetical protein V8E55_003882 [Tylopilus felleus]